MNTATAIDFLNRKLAITNGVTISYQCAATGVTLTGITAVPGHSTVIVQDGNGAIVQIPSNDFLIMAADIAGLGNGTYAPAKGDRVVAAGLTYELMNPPYTPSDHEGRRLRLHSVRTA